MAKANLAKQLIVFQGLINRALAADSQVARRVDKLAGKSLRIDCAEPAFDIIIEIDQQRLILRQCLDNDHQVNTHLQGKLSSFIEVASSTDKAAAIINSDVRLIGDSQLLVDLQEALNLVDIDWEFHLAQLLGDVPAHLLGNFARTSADHLSRIPPIFARHLQEYLLEEAKLVPQHYEVEAQQKDVKATRQQIDRVEAKLLQAKQLLETIQKPDHQAE